MYNNPYNREIKKKIGQNVIGMLHNRDAIGSGEIDGMTHHCQKCGEPYYGGALMPTNLKSKLGHAALDFAYKAAKKHLDAPKGGKITFKNVMHGYDEIAKRLKPVAKPITQALTNRAVDEIGMAAIGAGMHHRKGSRSKTHKGLLDYTTKRGDKDYHINGHDIDYSGRPYDGISGAGMRKKSSSWMDHVKKFSHDHNISYKEAMTKAKATYKR